MQTAQMNSPRFSYQTAAPMAATTPHTLDDFRAVHGSYAGSFSGKSSHPIWIAVGMIAAVAIIAVGVNMYSESHSAQIDTVTTAPNKRVLTEPTTPAISPKAVEAPVAKEIVPAETVRTPASSAATVNSVAPKNNETAKSAPVVTRRAAPTSVAPAQTVITPPEVVPPLPAIVEPTPTPQPIVIEPPSVPAPSPMPVPTMPSVEPPKL